jgi:diaminohydroxyphosphoribosylaminopyrimidine deaminase / 5-amino-6-(5-phosphoribosylamino)uracil reductase
MSELDAMSRAIELSRLGLGRTYPNPIVGAVIISPTGEVIGEGFHQGSDHAEVIAINNATNIPLGSTLFCTLEPCNHVGRTPACTDAIIQAGISKVVFAVSDPNPIAKGGEAALRGAGIDVVNGLMSSEAADANRDWLTKIVKARPRFTWKIASTLDGKTAAKDATSKWITSDAARSDVAILRSQADAILIGTGTVLADNPSLTSKGSGLDPVRIVMGIREIPGEFEVYSNSPRTIFIKSGDIAELLTLLQGQGFNRVLIESGPTLGTALLKAGLIDEVILYQAPTFLGSGTQLVSDLGISTLAERMDFEIKSVEKVGPDIKTVMYLKGGK